MAWIFTIQQVESTIQKKYNYKSNECDTGRNMHWIPDLSLSPDSLSNTLSHEEEAMPPRVEKMLGYFLNGAKWFIF